MCIYIFLKNLQSWQKITRLPVAAVVPNIKSVCLFACQEDSDTLHPSIPHTMCLYIPHYIWIISAYIPSLHSHPSKKTHEKLDTIPISTKGQAEMNAETIKFALCKFPPNHTQPLLKTQKIMDNYRCSQYFLNIYALLSCDYLDFYHSRTFIGKCCHQDFCTFAVNFCGIKKDFLLFWCIFVCCLKEYFPFICVDFGAQNQWLSPFCYLVSDTFGSFLTTFFLATFHHAQQTILICMHCNML